MGRSNPYKHVHMVGSAVDDERRPLHFADDPAEIRKQIGAEMRFDQGASPVCREDHVKQDVAGCVGHDSFAPPGLGDSSFGSPPPTACAVGCILSPLRGSVLAAEGVHGVADEGVHGELVRAANPPVPRTRTYCEPVRTASTSTCSTRVLIRRPPIVW